MLSEESLVADLKQALIQKDALSVSVVRMLKSELHNAHIAKGDTLTDEEKLAIVQREVKKRREAAGMYSKAGHTERASQEEAEANILKKYLPQIDLGVVKSFAEATLAQLPDRSPRQKGVLIREIKEKFGSGLAGNEIAELVDQLLQG